ncbi:MAG: hypothetical protein ACYSPI_09600 [Planctomycetota bacterium]
MNNPFEEVNIHSVDVKMIMEPVNKTASVWAVDVNRTDVYPGQTLTASVTLRSYRLEEQSVTISLEIPKTLAPGNYKVKILGADDYQSFVSKMAPQKYAVMETPASGVVIRQHELGQLPGTKTLLMQDSKRLQPLEAYKAWVENHIGMDMIVQGSAEIEITVKQ